MKELEAVSQELKTEQGQLVIKLITMLAKVAEVQKQKSLQRVRQPQRASSQDSQRHSQRRVTFVGTNNNEGANQTNITDPNAAFVPILPQQPSHVSQHPSLQ